MQQQALPRDPQPTGGGNRRASAGGANQQPRKEIYNDYITQAEATAGVNSGKYKRGRLRVGVTRTDAGWVTVLENEGKSVDYQIPDRIRRNRAVHGDTVVFQVLDMSEWGEEKPKYGIEENREKVPTGQVVYIEDLEGTNKKYFATLQLNVPVAQQEKAVDGVVDSNLDKDCRLKDCVVEHFDVSADVDRLRAVPVDVRIPWMILPIRELQKFMKLPCQIPVEGVFEVQIECWDKFNRLPRGRLLSKCVGDAGDPEFECHMCLVSHQLADHERDFPREVEEDATRAVEEIRETFQAEIARRRDLRGMRVMTIDPMTARDLDDAVSIKAISDDLYEIGVHIADVSHFVKSDSPMDIEARKRATTVYLTTRAYHMLPRKLCEDLCSLNPNEDKLTYSVVFRVKGDGELCESFKPQFFRSVIRCCCRMHYEQAQEILDGMCDVRPAVTGGHLEEDVFRDLMMLNEVAAAIGAKRMKNGSLRLSKIALRFSLDDKLNPSQVCYEDHCPTHSLIEELMLMCNKLVAGKLLQSCFSAVSVLRNHPQFSTKDGAKLSAYLASFPQLADVELSSAGGIYHMCQNAYKEHGFFVGQTLELLCMKIMKPAKYFCGGTESPHHFALNFDHYTHFTSPIRRYPDIMVHRCLTAVLAYEQDETADVNSLLSLHGVPSCGSRVSSTCDIANEKKLSAKNASLDCAKSFYCMFLRAQSEPIPSLTSVLVIGEDFLQAFLPHLGSERPVYYDTTASLRVRTTKITRKFRRVPTFPAKYEPDIGKSVRVTWKRTVNGKEEIKIQDVKVFSNLPVYMLATVGVPIDFVCVPISPFDPKYHEVLGDPDARMAVEDVMESVLHQVAEVQNLGGLNRECQDDDEGFKEGAGSDDEFTGPELRVDVQAAARIIRAGTTREPPRPPP